MKRTVKIVALTIVVSFLASSAALAATPWLSAPRGEGDAYRRPGGLPIGENPVRMPGTMDDNPGGDLGNAQSASAGPSLTGDDLLSPRGSALVMPTGSGPMYSTKQQGDRQIGQLIKQLG